jgi:hypothetical protein
MSATLVRSQCGTCGAQIPAPEGPRIRCQRCGAAYDLRTVASVSDGPMRSMDAYELAPTSPPPAHRRLWDRSQGRVIRHVQIQGLSSAAHGSGGWLWAGMALILVPLMLSAAGGTMAWSWVWGFGIALGIPAILITLLRSRGGEELRIEGGTIFYKSGTWQRRIGVHDVAEVRRAPRSVIIVGRDGTEISIGEASTLDYSALDWLHRHINDGIALARERPSLQAPP